MPFLPSSKKEMQSRGWDQLDIIIVSGDAYVDHPAWAAALLGRFLEARGYRVGIIAQPCWDRSEDIEKLGAPRLFFAVSAGNLDSMVNHYTADRKRRRQDLYSPGGVAGRRPDRATIPYCSLIKHSFPGVPVIIGGIEASLRRFAHYDYWSDSIRRSMLLDSKASLLVYGMGEYTLLEIAKRLDNGADVGDINDLPGTCYVAAEAPPGSLELPSFDLLRDDPRNLGRAARLIHQNVNPKNAQILAENNGGRWVVQNPPPAPLSTSQLDRVYEVDFNRTWHPEYDQEGGVPALLPVQFSITTHRGCFGGCSFCALALHQGKLIQSRSLASIEREARALALHPEFKGTISDVGGPSANMYDLGGLNQDRCKSCRKISCLSPRLCSNLNTDHSASVKLLKRVRSLPGIKHVFVASGVRYDLILGDKSPHDYLGALCRYHIGGQLKIAPEHTSPAVTRLMNKPPLREFLRFQKIFEETKKKLKRNIYLIPYFISAHPGCRLEDNIEMAGFFRDQLHLQPEQIQNFTPTPMTISTAMYVSGFDPESGREIYTARLEKERRLQRAVLQYRDPRNRRLVEAALKAYRAEDPVYISLNSLLKRNKPGLGESLTNRSGTVNKRNSEPKKQHAKNSRKRRRT